MSDDINRVKRVVFRMRRDGWWKFKTKSNAEKIRDQQKNRNRVGTKKCEIVGVPPTHRRIGKTADKIKNERRRRFAVRKESSPTASGGRDVDTTGAASLRDGVPGRAPENFFRQSQIIAPAPSPGVAGSPGKRTETEGSRRHRRSPRTRFCTPLRCAAGTTE